MGSAWAMFEQGKLYYYTYTYDHPFLGWLQIGAFSELVGGVMTFGTSVNTGRVLMLIIAVFSTLLVFLIVHRATGRAVAALFAAVIFAVSPLGVLLHRQVWLDNIATLWLLVSLYALLTARGNLWWGVLSALAFSVAFWSKEIVVVFLPGMLYLAYTQAHPAHRHFAFSLWAAAVAAATSLFVVLALLKDEFLPPGVLWSSSEPHVSLLETYHYHASRGGGGSILSSGSDFRTFLGEWISLDPFLLVGGLVAAGLGLLFWRRDKFLFGISLLVIPFMLFLARGGVVRYFYVIPLLALLPLALGLLAGHAANAMDKLAGVICRGGRVWRLSGRRLRYPATLTVLALTVVLGLGAVPANYINFNGDRSSSQTEAARWVAENLPNESVILMDPYPWSDLRAEELVGDKPFRNAHSPLTALQDPAIRSEVLREPGDIDYMLYSTSEDQKDSWEDGNLSELGGRDLSLIPEARENSDRIRTFSSGDWKMELLRVRKLHQIPAPDDPILANTWESYKERFVEDGRVVDPKADGLTTSEGQSYALLRAVYMNDQETFEKIWGWTKENLQVVRGDGLFAWKYGEKTDGTLGVTDESAATDADTDAALALLFAAQQWNESEYEEEALKILDDVWEKETVVVGSSLVGEKRVVVAGDWARGDEEYSKPVINPSYFSPYAYKIFAEADPGHPWDNLVDSSYEILESVGKSPDLGGEAGFIPDWVSLDPDTVEPLPTDIPGTSSGEFSFDASRIPWRITLDYLWFYDDRALRTLEGLSFPRQELEREGRLFAAYDSEGSPTVDYEAVATYAGVLPGLLFGGDQSSIAHQVFAEKLLGDYTDGAEGAYWGEDPNDYYNQNMAWFATAVMDGSMSNLWAGKKVINWDEYPLLLDQQSQ